MKLKLAVARIQVKVAAAPSTAACTSKIVFLN
jgi:hypothetical protein